MSELVKALIAARKEMTAAKKGKDNPFFKSKYADLSSVIEAVKDALEAHGLSFVQDIEGGSVVTVILHESGESMRLAPFPILTTKQDAQGFGSGVTYARRYSLQCALGVPAEDDDGNAASQPKKEQEPPNRTQVMKARQKLQEHIAADRELGILEEWGAACGIGEEFAGAVWSGLTTPERDVVRALQAREREKKVSAEHRATA
jgi:hypothetical protein